MCETEIDDMSTEDLLVFAIELYELAREEIAKGTATQETIRAANELRHQINKTRGHLQ